MDSKSDGLTTIKINYVNTVRAQHSSTALKPCRHRSGACRVTRRVVPVENNLRRLHPQGNTGYKRTPCCNSLITLTFIRAYPCLSVLLRTQQANNIGRGPSNEPKLYYRPVNRKHCPKLDSGLKVDKIFDKTAAIVREDK